MAAEDQRKRVEELFQQLLDRSEEERAGFLDAHAADSAVREELESLLFHYGEATSLEAFPLPQQLRASRFDCLEGQEPERIGRYRILRKIGEGGMGVVYEAEQEAPRRTVAIKLIRPGLHPERRLRRFRTESELLARLQHPGIAHVYEAGMEELGTGVLRSQVPYIVMEFIRGDPLHVHVRDRRLPPRDVLRLFVRICDAVQHAHRKGIVHRDLKPPNVLVDEQGNPKVLDFGVSRAIGLEGDPLDLEERTATGEVLGTLAYMSPEQLQLSGGSSDADTRSDVYALGVMLYELLTGRLPLDVQELPIVEAARRIANELPAPVTKLRPELGSEIETMLAKCLEKDPARRYSSPEDLARDLQRYLAGEPIEAKRDSRWYVLRTQVRRHRLPVVIATLGIAVLLASSAVAWMLYASAERARSLAADRLLDSYEAQARALRSSRAVGRRFESMDVLARAAARRPSLAIRNEALAAMALPDLRLEGRLDAGHGRVFCQGLERIERCGILMEDGSVAVRAFPDGADLARLVGPEGFQPTNVRFSPEGFRLAVRYDRQGEEALWLWDIARSRPILRIHETIPGDRVSEILGRGSRATGRVSSIVAFSSLESAIPWIAVGFADGTIRCYSQESGALLRTLRGAAPPFRLAADPSGRCLASSSLSSSGIEIWDLQTGRIARVLDPGGIPYALAFSPDGEQLAAGCSDFQARVFRLGSGTAPVPSLPPRNLEPPRRDAEPILLTGHQSAIVDVGFVGDRVLCTAGWDATVRFWDLSSASELLDPLYGRSLAGIADRIALQDASGTLAVYSFSPGYGMRVLRSPVESGVVGHASFLPDGRHLVSASVRGGVRLWNLTTGNSAVLSDEPSRSAVLLPDHGLLVALSPRGLLAWKHDLSRAQDLVLAAPSHLWRGEEAMDVDRGPDGSVLSVVERGGRVILLDTGATPGAVLRSYPGFGGLVTSCMSADGRWLFLGSWKGGESRLLDAQTGDAILTFPGPHVRGLFAPDGRHLLVTSAVEARLLDLGTWQEAARFALTPQTSDLAGLAAFRPDGHVLALTPNRFQVELVSVPDGHTLATLPNPSYAAILDLAFSDDARLLAAMTPGREILVWDLEGMQAALEPLGLAWDE